MLTIRRTVHSLSAPGGGEGWGEVGDSSGTAGVPPACRPEAGGPIDAHLTLPALRAGPLPLPPEGWGGNCRRRSNKGSA